MKPFTKPFTRTEMKMLVYNKMKLKGMDYESACKQVMEEVEIMNKNKNIPKEKEIDFKEEFKKLK